MSLVLASQSVPLHVDADGVIRVAHPRVTLETVIAAFAKGATAEHIAQDYPVVPLAETWPRDDARRPRSPHPYRCSVLVCEDHAAPVAFLR
jgi:hypothetical protein